MNSKLRTWYLSHGICPACGQRDLQRGYKLCLECRMIYKERAANRKPRTPEQLAADRERQHRLRAERIAQGLCPRCGKRKPESGYAMCVYCRAKAAAQAKKRYSKKDGTITAEQRGSGWYCWRCTAELPEWRENKTCDKCLAELRVSAAYARTFVNYKEHTYRKAAHDDVQRIAYWRVTNDQP